MKRGGPLRRDPEKTRAWQQRSKPLKAGKPLRRKSRKQQARKPIRKSRPKHDEVAFARKRAAMAFRAAARDQRVCAVCGSTGPFDAHHVVERQYLRQNGLPEYIAANALRLCKSCHHRHTTRAKKVRLKDLLVENLEYAIILLGPGKAENYLRRNYAGADPRFNELLEEANG